VEEDVSQRHRSVLLPGRLHNTNQGDLMFRLYREEQRYARVFIRETAEYPTDLNADELRSGLRVLLRSDGTGSNRTADGLPPIFSKIDMARGHTSGHATAFSRRRNAPASDTGRRCRRDVSTTQTEVT
jgi:hypothetical protein